MRNEKSHQFDFKHQWSSQHFAFVVNPFFNTSMTLFQLIQLIVSGTFNTYRIYDYEQFNEVVLYGIEANIHFHPHFLHNLHFEQSYSF